MWILESSADFFRGKRLWLKPGKRYLFGRVKRDDVYQAIDNPSLSRKHFIIEVHPVKAGDSAHIHARSKITITDCKSKRGTVVNNERIIDDSRDLTGSDEHTLQPGNAEMLTIRWHPVVLSFSFSTKEKKAANGDPLRAKRERLEQLDIKVVTQYLPHATTHIIASKRNTAFGLQALIYGGYIVADSYVDAFEYATTPQELDEEETFSLLEQDFDANYPDPTRHLPAAGKEPTTRIDSDYAPMIDRKTVFEDWTFIFADKSQHETLVSAITAGHGKALLWTIEKSKTTIEDGEIFVRQASNQKSTSLSKLKDEDFQVILVSFPKDPSINDLVYNVAARFGLSPIDQADFIDAIVSNTATVLKRPAPETHTGHESMPPPTASPSTAVPLTQIKEPPSSTQQSPSSAQIGMESLQASQALVNGHSQARSPSPSEPPQFAQSEESQPPAKKSKLSKFRKVEPKKAFHFDDGFDSVEKSSHDASRFQREDSQDNDFAKHFRNDRSDRVVSEAASGARGTSLAPSQDSQDVRALSAKRSIDQVEDSEHDSMDELFPAAAAIKRQRREMEREAVASGKPLNSKSTNAKMPAPANPLAIKKRKPARKIDVHEEARKHREEQELQQRGRTGAEEQTYELDYDPQSKTPANLVEIIELDLPVRTTKPTRSNDTNFDRWKDEWNGRKNFKKFRRSGSGEGAGSRRITQNVIVSLVEHETGNFGIGEQYWSGSKKKKKKGDHGTQRDSLLDTQTQTETQPHSGSRNSRQTPDRPNTADSHSASPQMTRLQAEAESIVGEIDASAPRRTRADDSVTQSADKRSMPPPKKIIPQKRQSTIRTKDADSSESEDSDDMKFKLKKRKK